MSISLGAIALPDDLVWIDEFTYSSVAQNQERTLTGKLIVEESQKIKGRPITLHGGDSAGWTNRSTMIQIQALADTADTDLQLSFHDVLYTVRFDRKSGNSPVDGAPILSCTDPDATDPYSITIRLMTV